MNPAKARSSRVPERDVQEIDIDSVTMAIVSSMPLGSETDCKRGGAGRPESR